MRTIFDTCEPRIEVLQGELKEEIFAARLKDVLDGKAEVIYQDPTTFFDNTYPTAGLKDLLSEALGRLTGVRLTNNPIIRLEAAFGGGKTHNLIGLYHTARGEIGNVPPEFVNRRLIPPPGIIAIAGLVGSDLDPSVGIQHPDATTYTLWGELAYQLGGASGYELVGESDRQSKSAPGAGVWERILGDRPALIMLDEVVRHLRSAKGVGTATGKGDLAAQTVAFLISLLEFAASKKRVVVVLTLADPSDALGEETAELREELMEAQRVSARQERVITPTGESEMSAIVAHRLFRRMDRAAARAVADAYHAYLARLLDQGADLPQRAGRDDYAEKIVSNYPFHPELLTTLNRKTSTIPNFERTRGTLRLLALAVRRLWQKRPANCFLIHPHHVDLSVDQIAGDLTSRLQRPAFKLVIEADIVSPELGSTAHAQTIDVGWVDAGKPPYAQRVATTVFLHSLTQGVTSGVDPTNLVLAVVQVGDDPVLIGKATKQLVDTCWFFDYDGQRYRFKTEPSLNKIVADEIALVGKTKAKAELDQRISQIWRKDVFQPVVFPSEAREIDDDAKEPKLVVVHYDAATAKGSSATPPKLIRKLFDQAGTVEGYRIYKNNLVFLVPDFEQVNHLVEITQKHLAIGRIVSDAARMGEFNEEQRKKLKQMLEASELDVRVGIAKAYRYLYYPNSDAPQGYSRLAREILPTQDQGEVNEVNKDQAALVLRVLRQLDKVLTAEDKPLEAAYVKAKAWDAGQAQMSTEDLRRAFAKRMELGILLDLHQLKKAIRDGAKEGVWIYYDPQEQVGYGPPSPAPLVQIDEDTLLYTADEAKRLGIPIKGEELLKPTETCPVCRNTVDTCICGEDIGNGTTTKAQGVLHAEGAPVQVFQAIVDQCQDQAVTTISRLFIRTGGNGEAGASDARSLGLAVSQLDRGQFRIDQTMGAEFGTGEQFSLTFAGSWDRYKQVKALTDAFGQEATKVVVKTTVRADFPDGLEVTSEHFQTIRDVFTTLGLRKLVIDAQPATADEKVIA